MWLNKSRYRGPSLLKSIIVLWVSHKQISRVSSRQGGSLQVGYFYDLLHY